MLERAAADVVAKARTPLWFDLTRFQLALLAGILAPLPLLFAERLPMVDLPQYAAQVSMFKAILAGNWQYEELFRVNLLIPYWGAYGPLWLLSHFMSLTLATKLVTIAALSALPVATAFLLRRFGSDPLWSWLLIPASFGFAFNWGFLNYLVAAPVGVSLLIAAESHIKRPGWLGAMMMALLVHVLFFSHVLVLFFFGGLAGVLILLRSKTLRQVILGVLPLISVAPLGLAWGLGILSNSQVQSPTLWEWGWHRLPQAAELLLGAPSTINFIFLLAVIFLLPLAAGARFSRMPERWVPLLFCLAIVAFGPNLLAGTYFVYHRFALFLVPLYLLALDAPRAESRTGTLAAVAVIILGVAWTAGSCVRMKLYDRESSDFSRIVESIPPDKRVLSLVFERSSRYSIAPVYLHYPAWYQAARGGVMDFSFASFVGMPVQYKDEYRPLADSNFVWHPQRFNWDEYGNYDYLLLRVAAQQAQGPLNLENCRAALSARSGTWWLYEVRPLRDGRAPPC